MIPGTGVITYLNAARLQNEQQQRSISLKLAGQTSQQKRDVAFEESQAERFRRQDLQNQRFDNR